MMAPPSRSPRAPVIQLWLFSVPLACVANTGFLEKILVKTEGREFGFKRRVSLPTGFHDESVLGRASEWAQGLAGCPALGAFGYIHLCVNTGSSPC